MLWSCPPIWLLGLWTLWLLQALWGWHNTYKFGRLLRVQGRRADGKPYRFTPPAAVIVPVKGLAPGFAEHLESLLDQDYPSYRLLLVVESDDDPACDFIARRLERPTAAPARLLVAGPAPRGGQKVWNLLAAVRHLTDRDQALVFADADAVPDRLWLARLVSPLYKQNVGATTGYRWLVPDDDHWASAFASVINGAVATLAGPNRRNHAWGGSMAILHRRFVELDVAGHWQGALSDDFQLTRAVARAGLRIYFIPRCLVPAPVRFTWPGLLAFARRQYLITRLHAPWLWLAALAGTGLGLAGWTSALVGLAGRCLWALPVIAAVYLMDLQRGRLRCRIVRQALGDQVADRLARPFALDCYATALCLAVHLALVLSSAVGRRIHWAGLTYRIDGPQRVVILHRQPLTGSTPPRDRPADPHYTGPRPRQEQTMNQTNAPAIQPGMTVQVVQQVPLADTAWTSTVRGTVIDYRQKKTGSWYAHARDEKLWLDRLTLRADDGEIVELSLDEFSRIEVL